ncbi:hypothetical protein L5849_15685, partial [Erythrobacter sp. SN021]
MKVKLLEVSQETMSAEAGTGGAPPQIAVCPVPVDVPPKYTPEQVEKAKKDAQEIFDNFDL